MPADNQGVGYVNIEGQLSTYSAVANDYAPYATATDMVVLQNPATSTFIMKVTRVSVSGVATVAAFQDVYMYIRTALNTGGTNAQVTDSKHDSNSVASSGNMFTYSVAPTLNGTATLVRADRLMLAASGTPVSGTSLIWEFGVRGGSQAIHLRPGQQLSLNNNSVAIPAGMSLYVAMEWNESTPVQ